MCRLKADVGKLQNKFWCIGILKRMIGKALLLIVLTLVFAIAYCVVTMPANQNANLAITGALYATSDAQIAKKESEEALKKAVAALDANIIADEIRNRLKSFENFLVNQEQAVSQATVAVASAEEFRREIQKKLDAAKLELPTKPTELEAVEVTVQEARTAVLNATEKVKTAQSAADGASSNVRYAKQAEDGGGGKMMPSKVALELEKIAAKALAAAKASLHTCKRILNYVTAKDALANAETNLINANTALQQTAAELQTANTASQDAKKKVKEARAAANAPEVAEATYENVNNELAIKESKLRIAMEMELKSSLADKIASKYVAEAAALKKWGVVWGVAADLAVLLAIVLWVKLTSKNVKIS